MTEASSGKIVIQKTRNKTIHRRHSARRFLPLPSSDTRSSNFALQVKYYLYRYDLHPFGCHINFGFIPIILKYVFKNVLVFSIICYVILLVRNEFRSIFPRRLLSFIIINDTAWFAFVSIGIVSVIYLFANSFRCIHEFITVRPLS